MKSPGRDDSCEGTEDTVFYFGLIYRYASRDPTFQPNGKFECIRRVAQSVAERCDSQHCSEGELQAVVDLIRHRC